MVLFQKKRNIGIIFDIFIYFAHTKFDVSVLARITFYYFFFQRDAQYAGYCRRLIKRERKRG